MLPAANVPVIPLNLILVLPSDFFPMLLSKQCILLFAKYVKQFNHSTLAPLVADNASTPGVIKVTEWNSILASRDALSAYDPSTNAPLPASPLSNPLGSDADVTVPFVITVTFLI